MKKLVLCVIALIMVLGLAACNRASHEVHMEPQLSDRYIRQQLGLQQYGFVAESFELPLTGGSGRLFSFGRAGDSAPVPAAVPAATAPPGAATDSATPPGQTDWEDMAESDERLVIQNASIEMETEDFREVEAALRRLAPSVNGFIASDMLTTRGRPRFTIVMRVPAASFEDVLAYIEGLAYVRYSNQWAQDVTDQFFDMAASYGIRRLEEERILALIDQAETVQELLALERRLGETRRSIERYLSQLNLMAGQVAYSTITVTLVDVSEVPVYITGPDLGARVGGAFSDSVSGTVMALQDIVVFFAGAIVPLMLIGVVGFGIYMVVRLKTRKKYS